MSAFTSFRNLVYAATFSGYGGSRLEVSLRSLISGTIIALRPSSSLLGALEFRMCRRWPEAKANRRLLQGWRVLTPHVALYRGSKNGY
jgi:hypothetical protein